MINELESINGWLYNNIQYEKVKFSEEMILMKKFIIFLTLLFVCTTQAMAIFNLYEIKDMTKEELAKLSKDALLDLYTNALIEKQANETFHGKAGFSPKEYDNYKILLNLIIKIRQEMINRDLEPPPIDQWIK